MNYNNIHFVGIGGIGMSGIAAILKSKGRKVSGSDIKDSVLLDSLRRQGVVISIGHREENINGADLLVYSSAIKPDNPEIIEARKRKIPVMKRAECLAALMKDKISIVVSGSHGKTTTSSLSSCLLSMAGLFPTAAIGGLVLNWNNNICLGQSDYFVAEADESDGTFLNYEPDYSLVMNIDHEHLDYYADFSGIIEAFGMFLEKTKDKGCVIACGDDKNIKNLLSHFHKRYLTFGFAAENDISAGDVVLRGYASEFSCVYKAKILGKFKLSMPGRHNISNSLAVIALGLELGIDIKKIYESLVEYRGTGRRLQVKSNPGNFLIIDDYAHHPTEIKAALASVRSMLDTDETGTNLRRRRIIAVFQPHRYSRTKFLLDDFSKSFALADHIIITDIYAANELPIAGITAEALCEKIKKIKAGNVEFIRKEEIAGRILEIVSLDDVVVTLGAGDIGKVADELSSGNIGKN